MNGLDYTVLISSLLLVVGYGYYISKQAKSSDSIKDYIRGDKSINRTMIGLSVMATQASAITFISTPALGYTRGMDYIQNYFGMPLALIVISAFIIPIYQKLKVFTAYEYLEKRFDLKTRLLTSSLFLVVRGLSGGMTIFAPTIVLSQALGWPLVPTAITVGGLVILYTVLGGTLGVSATQKYQMMIMFLGIIFVFFYCINQFPDSLSFFDSLKIAGKMDHLNAINWSFDVKNRYNIWNGILAGFFLSLSYFGTDQSQVQRYLAGGNLIESRWGLIFNAIFKIPLQFFILLIGVLVFIFFQFTAPKINFRHQDKYTDKTEVIKEDYYRIHADKKLLLEQWIENKDEKLLLQAKTMQKNMDSVKLVYNDTLVKEGIVQEKEDSEDKNFVFISYIIEHIPHGFIGLLIAMILAAAMSSSSGELNALGTTTSVDFFQRLYGRKKKFDDRKLVLYTKGFTIFWGLITIIVALNGNLIENLIEAINIIGSLFYGVILGVFLIGFFFKKIKAFEVFIATIVIQILVFYCYFTYGDDIAYLWYNMSSIPVIVLAWVLTIFRKKRG